MKEKFVPLEKQSKRSRRAYHSVRRKSWGGMSPVTRRPKHPKAYDRRKSGPGFDGEPLPGFLVGWPVSTAYGMILSRLRGSEPGGRFLWRSALQAIQRNRPPGSLPGFDLKAVVNLLTMVRFLKELAKPIPAQSHFTPLISHFS